MVEGNCVGIVYVVVKSAKFSRVVSNKDRKLIFSVAVWKFLLGQL
jgi:hypothetical protein